MTRLHILFEHHEEADDVPPWPIAIIDEYSLEEGGGDDYEEKKGQAMSDGMKRRELIVEVPEAAIDALFTSPTVSGKVVKEGAK